MKKMLLAIAAAALLTGCETDNSQPLKPATVGYDTRWWLDDNINTASGSSPPPYTPYRR